MSLQNARWRVLSLGLAAVCVGCWEEIHYSPSATPASADVDSSRETDETPTAAADADAVPTAVIESIPFEPTTSAAPPADSSASVEPAATPHQRLLAWRAASKWSLAAAVYAKRLEPARYEPLQQEAAAAASELDLELPALPTTEDETEREAAVIEGLRTGVGIQLADAVEERFGAQAGAAARLAVSSHLLLLVYSPQEPDAVSHASALREAAEAAELPADLWQPLIALLESQAEYLPVRGAVFELHRQVEEHLGQAANLP
jgi:hypothetical protein